MNPTATRTQTARGSFPRQASDGNPTGVSIPASAQVTPDKDPAQSTWTPGLEKLRDNKRVLLEAPLLYVVIGM